MSITIEKRSGNVYADLGMADAQAGYFVAAALLGGRARPAGLQRTPLVSGSFDSCLTRLWYK